MSIENRIGFLRSFVRLLTLTIVVGAIPCANFAQQDNLQLKYGWQEGKKYGYEFEAIFEIDGASEKATGFATYEVKAENVAKDLDGQALELLEEGEATSTAFAVTSDGYLLTCAHCIEGAKSIDVLVNGKNLKARLVEADYGRDLAIIKIEANDLPTVSLGKENKVELAQDIRAIGFPLSDVLGSSVKVAKGSIAGFVEEGGITTYQVDVAVNPGNSGGPLVDENGSVIGVVNAKLNGRRISKVGFAIPVKFACQMLDRNNIDYDSEPKTKTLSGPELARKLAPAVFFVKAEIGPGGHAILSNFKVAINGSMNRTDASNRKRHVITQSQAIIAAEGHLLDSNRETALPMLLGPICHMPFETLPKYATKRWTQVESFVLPLPKTKPQAARVRPGRDPFDPFRVPGLPGFGPERFGFGLGPRGFRGAQRPPQTTEMRMAFARQKTDYEIVKQEGDLVTVTCSVDLKTIDDQNEFCNLQIANKSTLTFDTRRGIFISKKLVGTIKLKMGDERLSFPLSLSYKQVDLDAFLGQPTASTSQREPAVVGLSDKNLDQFIESEPGEFNSRELLATLNKLANWNQAPLRKQAVVESIKRILNSETPKKERLAIKKLAIEALLNWDQTEATPFVIQAFEETGAFSKRAWIVKLGQTQHPDAARVLCWQLQNNRLCAASQLALINLGHSGEQAVIGTLREFAADPTVAQLCLEVMSKIGAEQSLRTIEQLAEPLEQHSKSAAQQALTRIQQRTQSKR